MKMPLICTAMATATTVALGALAAHAQPQQPPAQLGRWITESGNLEVDIAVCGDALCGTVTRVMANRSMSAPGQEMEAADKRPALGMQILSGLRVTGDGTLTGAIYNRENAKTYSVQLTMDGTQQMLVRPYVGIPLFGKTQLWLRAPSTTTDVEGKP
ncbi:DUF2147 domain-containing protein [Hylemonella sp. W303a]|uniref:DUF2147 domain-containing protein n=1 Tax=Hylemonella sp. W303a TaxID=3389873 RepID=UPI00396B11A5